MEKETTFEEIYKLLEENGWVRITIAKYTLEKQMRKYLTARVGLHGFFRLKKSNDDVEKGRE